MIYCDGRNVGILIALVGVGWPGRLWRLLNIALRQIAAWPSKFHIIALREGA